MGAHGRPQKKINEEFPQVADFSRCLRELIWAREITKEKLLEAAGVKGHSRLDCYLNGDAVPERRVLEVYFQRPLASFGPLRDAEVQELQVRYEAACQELAPRKATPADRVTILEHDLAAVWRLAGVFAAHNEQNRRVVEELRPALQNLEADLEAAKEQLKDAENAERHSAAQAELLNLQATVNRQELTARALEITGLQGRIQDLEGRLKDALTEVSQHKEAVQELEDNRTLYQYLSRHHRRQINALRKARERDEDKYDRASQEWLRAEDDWRRERAGLTTQVADLQWEVDRLKSENLQASTIFPIQGSAVGPVKLGRPGWHLDATMRDTQAYWDGEQWTGEKRPAPPMVRAASRPKGRHAKPEPREDHESAEAAWQGYCAGYTAAEHAPPRWAASVMAERPFLPEPATQPLLERFGTLVGILGDPIRQAFEAGFWRAIENKCITEGEQDAHLHQIKEAFRTSERVTGGGRHVSHTPVSPTAITIPDLPYALDDVLPTATAGTSPARPLPREGYSPSPPERHNGVVPMWADGSETAHIPGT
jgi:hypothetical protein